MIAPNCTTFRDMAQALSPSWLQGPIGVRLLYSLAIQFDSLADAAAYAVRAGLPTWAPSDALPWIGADRQIDRGPNEAQSSYMRRLQLWIDLCRRSGTPTGILLAARSYFYPALPRVSFITDQSTWYSYAAGAPDFPLPPDREQRAVGTWNWDGTSQPARGYLVIWADGTTLAASKTWGSGWTYGDGTVYGMTGTLATAALEPSIRAAVKKQKPANVQIERILISYSSSWLGPDAGANNPDGTWNNPLSPTLIAAPVALMAGVS